MISSKFIHEITKKDISDYLNLCDDDSAFFSDSGCFVRGYLGSGKRPAICYNDKETVLFLKHLVD